MHSARKGFTLIELLVVISIIAILSVVGITVFTGVQKSARDVKRRGDIDAIASAMEVHKGDPPPVVCNGGSSTSGEYVLLKDSFFASGKIPHDPLERQTTCGASNSQLCVYCDRSSTVSQGGSDPGAGNCANNLTVGDPNYMPNSGFNFGYYTWCTWPNYRVCTNLESGNPNYYCKSNQQ